MLLTNLLLKDLSALLMLLVVFATVLIISYIATRGGQAGNGENIKPSSQTPTALHSAGFTPAVLDEDKVEVMAVGLDTPGAERKPISLETVSQTPIRLTPYLEKKSLYLVDYLRTKPNKEASQSELIKVSGSNTRDIVRIMRKLVAGGVVGVYTGPTPSGGRGKRYYRLAEGGR